eukprot:Gb_09179 [translate_table: standard]
MAQKPHVAIFPSVGMGHLIPIAELAKRLAVYHDFSITLITSHWHVSPAQCEYTERLASSGLDIHFIQLPQVEIEEEEEGMKIETFISKFMDKSKPLVENVLRSLLNSSSPVSAFITDLFCTAMLDVGAKLHIPTYIFFTSNAALLCLMLHLPKLASEIEISFKDVDFPVKIPGLPPIPATDLPTPIQDRSDRAFHWFVHHSFRLREAKGILINTFHALETERIKALVEGKVLSSNEMPSIYPVGPLILESDREVVEEDNGGGDDEWLKWLEKQPFSSVLFVAFGSGVRLSEGQIRELALGLEASGQRFLWVVRSTDDSHPFAFLPEGFEIRTKDRGLLLSSWAPQIPILSHPSTGGFLSHCGWNSTLESISFGVPMIAWPFYAEQRLNRLLLVEEMKVAIQAKMEKDGVVRREEVERTVRELMEGEEGMRLRIRMKELQESANKAVGEGGSSYNALASVAAVWKTPISP